MSIVHYHEIIRPIFSQSFYTKMVDLWQGHAAGHIGSDMYQHHVGQRAGRSMSGVSTWVEYERKGTLPQRNKHLFAAVTKTLHAYVKRDMPLVEFGPGGMEDALYLVRATLASEYIPVDCSLELLGQAKGFANKVRTCPVRPAIIDFLSDNNCALVDVPALSALLGGTIANIPGPVPAQRPRDGLVRVFQNLMRSTPRGGYFLVSTDVCQDGNETKSYYNEEWHRAFGVNHLYRMAEECPVENFDPSGFVYEPVWHEQCSLLAHTVRATKDQDFVMGEANKVNVSVKKGNSFHCNSSYRFSPKFFESCASEAGLDVEHVWQEDGTIRMYLFRVPVQEQVTSVFDLHDTEKYANHSGAPFDAYKFG